MVRSQGYSKLESSLHSLESLGYFLNQAHYELPGYMLLCCKVEVYDIYQLHIAEVGVGESYCN